MSVMQISMESVSSMSCELHQQWWGGAEAWSRVPFFVAWRLVSRFRRGHGQSFLAPTQAILYGVSLLGWPPMTPLRRIALPTHPNASQRTPTHPNASQRIALACYLLVIAAWVKANDDMGLLDPALLPDACPSARDLGNRIRMVAG